MAGKNPVLKYAKNVLIAVDQLANTLAGGDPDETISSRCGKWHPWLAKIIDFLFGPKHCQDSIEKDEGNDSIIN